MVLPGDELNVKIRHIGVHGGNVVVKVETVNSREEKVLECSDKVARPNTMYVFTGQGAGYGYGPLQQLSWPHVLFGANAHLRALATSSWNWVRQDVLLMFYDIIFSRLTIVDCDITSLLFSTNMQYTVNRCDSSKGETYKLVKEVLGHPPVYKGVTFPSAPHTKVTSKGDIVYTEAIRENVRKLEAYVKNMTGSEPVSGQAQPEISKDRKNRIKALFEGIAQSFREGSGTGTSTPHAPRSRRSSSQFLCPQSSEKSWYKLGVQQQPHRCLDILHEIATTSTTLKDKNALLTGVGKGSIVTPFLSSVPL
ncbi:fatty acid synthase alpha subunit Lsd1 [Stygiomarasmius scandens]|uniref:Fatty acid synthase alpha subunit Lsd1 n=1 Tax=Marasmiellus scandens TaxID=2682957 RepID=A0ABR1JNX1_9AGAR